jgi:hypothetical protein
VRANPWLPSPASVTIGTWIRKSATGEILPAQEPVVPREGTVPGQAGFESMQLPASSGWPPPIRPPLNPGIGAVVIPLKDERVGNTAGEGSNAVRFESHKAGCSGTAGVAAVLQFLLGDRVGLG